MFNIYIVKIRRDIVYFSPSPLPEPCRHCSVMWCKILVEDVERPLGERPILCPVRRLIRYFASTASVSSRCSVLSYGVGRSTAVGCMRLIATQSQAIIRDGLRARR